MIGSLDAREKEQVLRTETLGRLGVYGGGSVHVFPVSYGYDGKDIYLQSRNGAKIAHLRAHPDACLEVEQITSPTVWRTVIAYGAYEEITEPVARRRALALIAAQGNQPHPPSMAAGAGDGCEPVVYCLRLYDVQGRYERDAVLVGGRERFG